MGVGLTAVAVLIALMQGVFSKTWSVTLPQSIVGIGISCITVPCHFEVPDDQEAMIQRCNNGGIWRKDRIDGPIVLDSHNPFTDVLAGEVIGDVTQKNCSTLFHSFLVDHSGLYYFRLDCQNTKFTFSSAVSITVQSDPAPPQLTFVGQVSEGDQVRLQCSAPVPCSIFPPSLTWIYQDGFRQEEAQVFQTADGQKILTSTLTFIASASHHNQTVGCSVSHIQTTGGSTEPSATTQRLHVLYAPRFTVAQLHASGPVSDGCTVMLTCSSDANPPVSRYTWYRDNGKNLTGMGDGETLVLQASQKDGGVYLCEARTSRGSQRSRPVYLEVNTCTGGEEPLVLHYLTPAAVLVLYLVTVTVTVLKFKSLSRRLKRIELKSENAYMSLKSCSVASDYDQMQPKKNPSAEASDYENTNKR